MDKFESSYNKYALKYTGYKVACNKCDKLYVKANDDPFVCLECGG
jgi:hypothetical protein